MLFVGTKRQASDIVADAAQRSAQYYVNSRWLGGMLTNWKTISNSISRLRKLDEMLAGEAQGLTKKERLNLDREREKLNKALGGIKDMGSTPDLMFVIDTNKEAIAILEAKRLGIPVVAIIDSNCDPDKIDFPIPGNDDAQRAIALYCDLIAKAALDGIARQQGALGVDIGASAEAPVEPALDEAGGEDAAKPDSRRPLGGLLTHLIRRAFAPASAHHLASDGAPAHFEQRGLTMSISAAQVKELRELTGAGMMDCKAALTETNGDMEAAVDWLRKKGISKADKKAGRTAAEGLIGVDAGLREAVVVEVNSETDFVARNEAFQEIVRNVAKVALAFGGKTETVADAKYPGSDKSVTDAIKDAVGTIGENLGFRRSAKLGVEHGAVATYVHNAVADNLGKLGVLVAIETAGKAEAAHAFARQVAMHVAATNPLALTPRRARSGRRSSASARSSPTRRASPASRRTIIEKMVEGRLRKFYEEVVLLKQAFVLNPDLTVEKALKEAEKEIGAPAKITGFLRFALGEGIEKEATDFAAEVAAAVKK